MSQENISFSNQTKALQAILRKRKQRTTDSGSETEPFPFGNDSQKAEKSAGLSLFSEEFLKELCRAVLSVELLFPEGTDSYPGRRIPSLNPMPDAEVCTKFGAKRGKAALNSVPDRILYSK